jgi:ribonucleotide monophosphatase NagD (HAD superfamily)
VVGLAPEQFNYQNINKAFQWVIYFDQKSQDFLKILLFRILFNTGNKLIAIHEGRYYKTEGEMSVGPGCFVKGLEYSCGVKSIVIGKPNEFFFRSALPDAMNPRKCIMIGDVSPSGLITYLILISSYCRNSRT